MMLFCHNKHNKYLKVRIFHIGIFIRKQNMKIELDSDSDFLPAHFSKYNEKKFLLKIYTTIYSKWMKIRTFYLKTFLD